MKHFISLLTIVTMLGGQLLLLLPQTPPVRAAESFNPASEALPETDSDTYNNDLDGDGWDLPARLTPVQQLSTAIYVDADAAGANDGTSWANAYANLQDALAAATAGSEIWVAEGAYTPMKCPVARLVPGPTNYWYETDPALPKGLDEIRLQAVFRNSDPFERDLQFSPGDTYQLWSVPGVISPPDLPVVVNQEPTGMVAYGDTFSYDLSIDVGALPPTETAIAIRPVSLTSGTMSPAEAPVVQVSFSCPLTNPADLHSATFQLLNGVALYGGFAGTETSHDQRDWVAHPTLLSGDIGTTGDSSDNSYHVVTGSGTDASAVLDGFTISGGQGGYADGPDVLDGGGMYNHNGSPTVRNVTFSGNAAAGDGGSGGGMYNLNSNPTLTNVTFTGNSGNDGGGMYNQDSNPTLTNVTFSGNSADLEGGGMYNQDSNPTLTNVTFSGNSAVWGEGGGMYNYNGSNPTLTNVTFSGNSADWGGGMSNYESSPMLVNVTFSGNSAISEYDGCGGGMYNDDSSPMLVNVIFDGNSAAGIEFGGGGGMCNYHGSSPTLTDVTFSGNSAELHGGGMYNDSSSPTLANCILWGNTAPAGSQISNSPNTTTISHSLVAGSGGSGPGWDPSLGVDGGGNLDADPQFVDADGPDGVIGTPDDNLRLRSASPAIDAGDNTALPPDSLDLDGDGDTGEPLPFDRDGRARIINGTVDMGAYESRAENAPPTAGDDTAATEEDTPVSIPVLDNDSDPDYDVLSVYELTQPGHGRVKRNGATAILYTPYLNFNGSDSFTYTAYDGLDGFDTATVNITVSPVNAPPTANDDQVSTPEDTPLTIDVLGNDSDPEGDPFSLHSFGQPGHGAAALSGAAIRYTPAPNFHGEDSFFYTLFDGQGSGTGNVRITVTPVNDAPSDISLSNASVSENKEPGEGVGSFSSLDPDSEDSHTYRLVSGDGDADNSAFVIVTSTLKTAASFDFETKNVYRIRVEADDGQGGSLAKPFLIQVTDANDAPTDINLSNQRLAENLPIGSSVGTLSASDPDSGDTHSFSLVSGTGSDDNYLFTISDNTLKTAASLDYEEKTTRSIRVQADDSRGGAFEKIFRIDILDDPSDPPTPPLSKCSGGPFRLINTDDTQITLSDIHVTEPSASGCALTGLMQITLPGGNDVTGLAFHGRVNQNNQLLTDGEADGIQGFDLNLAGLTLKAAGVVIDYYLERPMLRIQSPQLAIPAEWGGLSSTIPNPVVIDGSGLKFGVAEFGLPEIKTEAGFALSLRGELKPVAGGYEIKASGEFTIPNIGKKKAPGSEGQECSILVAVTIFAGADGRPTMLMKTQHTPGSISAQAVRLSEIQVGMKCSVGIPIDATGFALTGVEGTVSLRPDEEFVQLSVTISAMKSLGDTPLVELEGTTRVTINPAFRLDLSVTLKVLAFEMANASATITESSFEANLVIRSFIYEGRVSIHAWTSRGSFHFTGSGSIQVGVDRCAWVDGGCIVGYPTCSWCRKWIFYYPCHCSWHCVLELCIPPFSIWSPTIGCEFGEFTNGAYGVKGYMDLYGLTVGFYIDHTGDLDFGDVSSYHLVTSSQVQSTRQVAQSSGMIGTASVVDGRFVFPADNQVIIKTPLVLGSGQTLQALGTVTRTYAISQSDVSFVVNADGPLGVSLIAPNGDEITPDNYQANPTYTVHYRQETFYALDREPAADEGQARLRFVSASPSLEQVDVKVDGATIFASVAFTDPSQIDYVGLNPGSHTLDIVPVGAAQPALTAVVDAAPGQDYTLLTLGGAVPEAMVLSDDNRMPEALGQARVRFVNGSTNGPLDVFIGGTEVFDNLGYKAVGDYQPVSAGDHTFEIRHATSGDLLSPSQSVSFEAGRVYTFISADWPVDGYPLAWLQTVDEAYLTRFHTEYGVDQAEAGEWAVKLSGDLDESNYFVAVLGPANPPILRELSVDSSDLSQTQVSWRLTSDYTPTTVTVYATPGPITQTLTVTDTTGVPIEVVVPKFEGFAVDQAAISDSPHLAGELTTRSIDLSNLGTGDYHMWIRAEDGVNQPVSGYLAPPGAGDNAVEVARDDYDPLAQLANAAVIHVEHAFPSSWSTSIRPSLNLAETKLYVEWDALDHPDVDGYVLYVGTSPLSATRVISAGGAVAEFDQAGQAVGDPVGFATVSNIEAGRTYYLSVAAYDTETGRAVRSQETSVAVNAGDFYLSTPAATYDVKPGEEVVIPLRLVVSELLFYPEVSLGIDLGDVPLGITAQFADDLEGITTLSAEHNVVNVPISVAERVPEGAYVLSFTGYNGPLTRTLDVRLQVGKPTAITLVSFEASASESEVRLTWETAAEIDNEGFNIWRSETADGSYVKLNSSLIPAQGNADTGASYEYADTGVVRGMTYYYKLEDVDLHGVSTFHGPVSATPSPIRRIYLPVILK
jgi:hypothetical protein